MVGLHDLEVFSNLNDSVMLYIMYIFNNVNI